MKTKGIKFWEQHLEHMVLALSVLILLGFAALQFVGSPNSIPLPQGKQGQTVAPGEVDDLLAKKATDLQATMQNTTSVKLPDPVMMAPKFDQLKIASVNPSQTMFVAGSRVHPGDIGEMPTPGNPFVVAKIPAPYNVATEQYFDMLLPEVVEENPELKKILQQQPYDIMWVTASATFNMGEVLKQFRTKGPNGEAALPPSWYNDRVDF